MIKKYKIQNNGKDDSNVMFYDNPCNHGQKICNHAAHLAVFMALYKNKKVIDENGNTVTPRDIKIKY